MTWDEWLVEVLLSNARIANGYFEYWQKVSAP
jgi:hypothetical protein